MVQWERVQEWTFKIGAVLLDNFSLKQEWFLLLWHSGDGIIFLQLVLDVRNMELEKVLQVILHSAGSNTTSLIDYHLVSV